MPYVDPQTIDNPTAGQPIPAAWADQVRNDLEFLIDPPACSVYNSAAVSVPDATTTTLDASNQTFDNDSMWTLSAASKIVATTAGRYLLFARVQFAADVDGVRGVKFRVNNTTTHEMAQVPAVSAVSSIVLSTTTALELAATDYVELRVLHTAGGALNVTLLEFGATYLTR